MLSTKRRGRPPGRSRPRRTRRGTTKRSNLETLFLCDVPSREALVAKRAIHLEDLEPEHDDWNGLLGKDIRGVFTFATIDVPYHLTPEKGEKVYLEEFYSKLEKRILDFYAEAQDIFKGLRKQAGWGSIEAIGNLMRIESSMIALMLYHDNPPDGKAVLTDAEIDEVLVNQTNLKAYVDHIMTANTETMPTPLGIGSYFKRLFQNNVEIESVVDLFTFPTGSGGPLN